MTEKLGEGGMGSVYLALHPTIGKKVALKVLHSEFSNNQDVATRFFNEAKAVNDIGHPNIVDIVDFGIIQAGGGHDQLVYFIMEYLAGMTLSHLIRTESPLPPERALTIALQVADALSASHKCGIVHRDLKPDNIILLQRGRERDFVKLLDFGIAKLTGGSAMGSHRTRTGIVMGTPAYMSPEQCEGRDSVDLRTDIYALGIVMYEMLTGRVPFVGEGYGEILVQHLTQRPIPVSQFRMLPPHVEVVVMKALEKRPDLRYPTMEEFMRAMADPVGYVEAHGGVGGFLQRQLMPSSAPLPSVRLTPAPLTPMTPPPGSLMAPNFATPAPTTLNSAAGSRMGLQGTATQRPASKAGIFIGAAAAVVVAAVIAIVIVATGKDKIPDVGSNVASGSSDGSGKLAANDLGSAGGTTGTGSAATGSAAAGSAAAGGPGAGSSLPPTIPPTIPETGSAAGSDGALAGSAGSAGSGAGSGAGSATEPGPGSGHGGGEATVPIDTIVEIGVISTPPGAHIFVDGADTSKITPAHLRIPQLKGKKLNVSLRLKNYTTTTFKVDAGESSEQRYELVRITKGPTPVAGSGGSGSASHVGSGSASHTGSGGPKPNQDPDGLMKP
ncbi:MAG TPA: serine/threonine-protein kinase [Kofleriaceae bacterium]|nr:serine/threonine-protein kinase [Kofleriaceae bacterium]